MRQEIKDQFELLRTFLNNHADSGESTWEESEALESIYEELASQIALHKKLHK